ncbi:MAG TPA: hypothetical protein VMH38_04465 [Thermoplasmata archaeon]|nr:hypothetical protein [Thermoplasmata archaeon]
MTPYRATDEQLDREISALERIARIRLRRASAELNDIDRDLRELRREKARRAARAAEMVAATATAPSESSTAEG